MGWVGSVLRASVPGESARLISLDAAIRAPLPLSTGVGLLGAGPDAPTSVVGGLLSSVLGARRPHRVLAVGAARAPDPRPDNPRPDNPRLYDRGITWHAGLEGSAEATEAQVGRRGTARSGAEATADLARTPGGVWALDLAGDPARWWDSVAPISRFFDFVVTDWGAPVDPDDARAASGVLVVVAGPTRTGLQAGVDLVAQLTTPSATPLLVVHDEGGGAERGMAEAATANDAVWLPADRGLRASTPTPGSRLRYATNRAVLQLAARVVDAAAARNLSGVSR